MNVKVNFVINGDILIPQMVESSNIADNKSKLASATGISHNTFAGNEFFRVVLFLQ